MNLLSVQNYNIFRKENVNQAAFMGKITKWIIKLINQRAIAPINAGTNPVMVKPATIAEIPQIKRALITNVKRPKVKIVIGKVKIVIIGLIKALTIPKTRATIKAVRKESTSNPGT